MVYSYKNISAGNENLKINKCTEIASRLPLLAQLDISLGKFERPKSPDPNGNGPVIAQISLAVLSAWRKAKQRIVCSWRPLPELVPFLPTLTSPTRACLVLICHLCTCMRATRTSMHTRTRTRTHTFICPAQALSFVSTALFLWSTELVLTDLIYFFLGAFCTFQPFLFFFPP